jgi:hypothetical protein
MICDRCHRPMQFATDAGNWWCSHCHRRIRPTSAGLTAPRGPRSAGPVPAPAPVVTPAPAPMPAHVPAARALTEGPVPAPIVADGSAPAVMARPPMWPAVTSLVLAMIAVGMVAAVLVRCSGGDSSGEIPRGLLARLLPKQAHNVRGISFARLQSTEPGREVLAAMAGGFIDEVVERECDTRFGDVLGWIVRMDDNVSRVGGGLTAARVGWSEDQVNECLTKMARSSGGMLEVKREGKLRAYVVRERDDPDRDDQTMHAAWIESDIALVVADYRADRQRTLLEEVIERKEAEPGNDDLRRALDRVDTGATFWMAMSRPVRDDFPTDPGSDFEGDLVGDFDGRAAVERWYDTQIASLLGARPDAVYWSVDVGSQLVVRGGAIYKSARKAERVAAHVKEVFEAGSGLDTPDLKRIDPALREALEKRLRDSYGRARSLRGALLEAMKVDVAGDVVRFEAKLSLEVLEEPDLGRQLLDEMNSLLPDELAVKL